jgi:hypothetical protein
MERQRSGGRLRQVPGFGFNGGNWAQDFCIDNVWIEESSIDPDTPLPAVPMDERSCAATASCRSAERTGQLEGQCQHQDRPDP